VNVEVDADCCGGFGQCVTICPDVFELTDAGYAVVRVGQVLSQRSALRAGAVSEPATRALDSGWSSSLADRVESLLARQPPPKH